MRKEFTLTIDSHQELFEKFLEAQRRVICERHSDINGDCHKLMKWAQEYANTNGLVAPTDKEAYGIYWEPGPEW